MSLITHRINRIKSSPTLAVAKKAAELRQQGKNIISLSVGELNFDTPDNIKAQAIEAINRGMTKYTNVDGMPELKQAVKNKFKVENNLDYQLDELIVSSGAKQVIFNALLATLDIGDEVIIPTPYWVSYPDIVSLTGATSKFIYCHESSNFKITPAQLSNAITDKTKWLLLNSPNNPTGAIYTIEELKLLAEILSIHKNIHIMCDDIYEHIIFDNNKFYTLAAIAPSLKERIFIVNGVSKAYAMTGWRIGYGAGNSEIIKAMIKIQSHSTSNPCSISQVAAIEALTGSQSHIQDNITILQRNRDLAFNILNNTIGLKCYKPTGTFYLFVSCQELLHKVTSTGQKINTSNDFACYLLEEAEVSVVPSEAFGINGYFRLSYAVDAAELNIACLQIKKACEKLI
ncbi:pyridoxal phosphate-dependent aminotransferase [Orientia tsutsugamushi]|uniref:Aminotransferase n=1 Tax=Orientia tsutsugamushi TaxID=784 RepID=A0A2U3QVN8_ORITS|nr:pyridoxal phosphate-dependent aminotransferase [Orientia tsutsugamushi]KJV75283.1 degT/DnrJ/EryC1/StrS aminotransferase family protein [Orientia tsutsugamushi str. UT76]QES96402.1 pyridoxal phosphate-dependent aminotransferase [Orientia tsutsugamushi]SPR05023.1 aspartate aminotransferase [Orientia tsutsugamushi]